MDREFKESFFSPQFCFLSISQSDVAPSEPDLDWWSQNYLERCIRKRLEIICDSWNALSSERDRFNEVFLHSELSTDSLFQINPRRRRQDRFHFWTAVGGAADCWQSRLHSAGSCLGTGSWQLSVPCEFQSVDDQFLAFSVWSRQAEASAFQLDTQGRMSEGSAMRMQALLPGILNDLNSQRLSLVTCKMGGILVPAPWTHCGK